jgi:hypothetical protein
VASSRASGEGGAPGITLEEDSNADTAMKREVAIPRPRRGSTPGAWEAEDSFRPRCHMGHVTWDERDAPPNATLAAREPCNGGCRVQRAPGVVTRPIAGGGASEGRRMLELVGLRC